MKIEFDTDLPPAIGNFDRGTSLDDAHRLVGMRFSRLVALTRLSAPTEIIDREKQLIAAAMVDADQFEKRGDQ